ncbi:hypothetical protein MIND_00527700 [Mycena indigotica]|uniref:Uncharacterized protein n=1 Tax=Mycena indigotica TaxID=2126181 RepID=A0A8H6W756_9AGAR|nr:uncharacterized protein MIND_00527700 [Mycena indigotica]KAF7307337.1 hypothetical protein MIND_00527700 [Mycena indigotica]
MKHFASITFFSTLVAYVSCRAVDVSARAAAGTYPANFKPNFKNDYSVTINKPMSVVFPVLGTKQGLKETVLLSNIASKFAAGKLDTVAVSGPLEKAFVRTLPSGPAGKGFERQAFSYTETIKIIPGLDFTNIVVNLAGTFTSDPARNVSLYETTSDSNVTVRKTRIFTESNGKTTVTEHIDGQCAPIQQPIVQLTAASAHKQQMDLTGVFPRPSLHSIVISHDSKHIALVAYIPRGWCILDSLQLREVDFQSTMPWNPSRSLHTANTTTSRSPRSTSSKSRLGFDHVRKISPGLADYRKSPVKPKYCFGWLMSDGELRAMTPESLHWQEAPTRSFVFCAVKECCAQHGGSFEVSVHTLGNFGTDLMGRSLVSFTFVQFANNMSSEGLASAEDKVIIDSLTTLLKAEDNYPVWLLDDYRV